jgi:hypothetical protein
VGFTGPVALDDHRGSPGPLRTVHFVDRGERSRT